MPTWAAARCTSALVPYFKPLEWQGHTLFDGGFKLNCPASCAYSEAQYIWPDKRCDILLSLGAGSVIDSPRPPAGHKSAVASDLTDAGGTWDKFVASVSQQDRIFRLDPTYSGAGFALDEFRKLNQIERQVYEWILTQSLLLTEVCGQLIASLFFFCPLGPIKDGIQAGEILCRLPTDLTARQNLVDAMLQETDLNLFMVEYDGKSGKTQVPIPVGSTLRSLRSTAELCFHVQLGNMPVTEEVMIHVKMRMLNRLEAQFSVWLPISGSPYRGGWTN